SNHRQRFDPCPVCATRSREPQRNGDLHHLRQRTVLPFPS
ncbi:MAG: hypothetical protein, partial [Olavius algarvensis Gamma 1 endosymbiont]